MNYLVTVTAHFDVHVSANNKEGAIEKAEEAVYGFCDQEPTNGVEFDYCEHEKSDHIFKE